MSEQRTFYYPYPVNIGDRINIERSDLHHMKDVLRLSLGETVDIVTYSGKFQASIEQYKKNSAVLNIEQAFPKREPDYRFILWQSILKGSKMDEVIEKVTEMGISEIVPVITERTDVLLETGKENQSKYGRWQRIAIAASKQARRDFVPWIAEPVKLSSLLQASSDNQEIRIFFWECADQKDLSEYLKPASTIQKIILFIGPEGGFSQSEASVIIQNGFLPASLGPTILRAENAGFFALGLLQYLLHQRKK